MPAKGGGLYTRAMKTLLLWLVCAGALLAAESDKKPVTKFALAGDVFSAGMQQPYRFAGIEVNVFSERELPHEEKDFPVPAAKAVADINGHFTISVRPGDYTLYASAWRSYPTGRRVRYIWKCPVSISEDIHFDLNDSNAVCEPLTLSIR